MVRTIAEPGPRATPAPGAEPATTTPIAAPPPPEVAPALPASSRVSAVDRGGSTGPLRAIRLPRPGLKLGGPATVVQGPAAGAPPPTDAERALQRRILDAGDAVGRPENQIPKLAVGQGLVSVRGERNQTVEHEIVAIDGDRVSLKPASGGPTVTTTVAELSERLLDPAQHLEVRAGASITSRRVPAEVERLWKKLVGDLHTLAGEELRRTLGDQRWTLLSRLTARRSQLAAEAAGATRELRAWVEATSGWTSMSRIGKAAVAQGMGLTWEGFKANARNPELSAEASQRSQLARLERGLAAVDASIALVLAGKPIAGAVDAGADPALEAIVEHEATGSSAPRLTTELGARMDLLRQTSAAGNVADGWVAYHGAVQPYLHHTVDGEGSFHGAADGKASLTLAVNQVIQAGGLGDRRQLVLSAGELASLKDEVRAQWPAVAGKHEVLRGEASIKPAGWTPPFDAKAFDAEVERLRRLEAAPPMRELSAVLDRQQIDGAVQRLTAAEPGFLRRAGDGVLRVLDSPQTWAMIAVGAATAGTASALALGESAVGVMEIVNLARAGALSARSLALLGVSTAIDGAAFHTGMNAFNLAIGEHENIDFSAGGYARSVLMMGMSQSAQAGRALLQARFAPGLMRAVGAPAAHFAAETGGAATLAAVESYIETGNLDEAARLLEENAQFLFVMRVVHGTRKLAGGEKARDAVGELETRWRDAERAYRHAPSKEHLFAVYEAQRSYVQTLQAANEQYFARALAASRDMLLAARTELVSPEELRDRIGTARARAARSARTPEEAEASRAGYDALEREGVAVFDEATGRTYVEREAAARREGPGVLRDQWTRQHLEGLPHTVREAMVAAVAAHPDWPAVRDALVRADPHLRGLAPARLVKEVIARAHGDRLPPDVARLVGPLLALPAVVEAGLSTAPRLDPTTLRMSGGPAAGRSSPASDAGEVKKVEAPEGPATGRTSPTCFTCTSNGQIAELDFDRMVAEGHPAPGVTIREVSEEQARRLLASARAERDRWLADLSSAPTNRLVALEDFAASRVGQVAHMSIHDDSDLSFVRTMAEVGRVEGFRVMAHTGPQAEGTAGRLPPLARENVDSAPGRPFGSVWTEDSGAASPGDPASGARAVVSVPAQVLDVDALQHDTLVGRVRRYYPNASAAELRRAASVYDDMLRYEWELIDFGIQGAMARRGEQATKAWFAGARDFGLRSNLSYVEGGNLLTGTLPNGEPYAIVGKDSLLATRHVLERDSGRPVSDEEVLVAIAKDTGIARSRLYPVEQPRSFHIDMGMFVAAPGVVVVNDAMAVAEIMIERLRAEDATGRPALTLKDGRPGRPSGGDQEMQSVLDSKATALERPRSSTLRSRIATVLDLADGMKPLEDMAVADLQAAGLTVHRMPGRFFDPDSEREIMNFMNLEGGTGRDGASFAVVTGGEPWAEELVARTLLAELPLGLRRLYFTAPGDAMKTLREHGGLNCRVKWTPGDGTEGESK